MISSLACCEAGSPRCFHEQRLVWETEVGFLLSCWTSHLSPLHFASYFPVEVLQLCSFKALNHHSGSTLSNEHFYYSIVTLCTSIRGVVKLFLCASMRFVSSHHVHTHTETHSHTIWHRTKIISHQENKTELSSPFLSASLATTEVARGRVLAGSLSDLEAAWSPVNCMNLGISLQLSEPESPHRNNIESHVLPTCLH